MLPQNTVFLVHGNAKYTVPVHDNMKNPLLSAETKRMAKYEAVGFGNPKILELEHHFHDFTTNNHQLSKHLSSPL